MSTTRDERKQLFELKNKIESAIKNIENDKIRIYFNEFKNVYEAGTGKKILDGISDDNLQSIKKLLGYNTNDIN